jgi:hypothetical protein
MGLPLLVDTRFQDLFTPLSGVLVTFPSRYLFTIGQSVVFRLMRWSSQIQAGFHVSRLTWGTRQPRFPFRLRDSHPVSSAFPCRSTTGTWCLLRPRNPGTISCAGLASSPFARHYWGNHYLFSFPSGTEMFHFPEFAPWRLCIQRQVRRHYTPGVSPFGHSRIIAWLAAPRDFSQPPTSFIASDCLGIHRVPFVAWSLPPLFVLLRHVERL